MANACPDGNRHSTAELSNTFQKLNVGGRSRAAAIYEQGIDAS
jgi:hypothetical protein